jgi:hypothetical protein
MTTLSTMEDPIDHHYLPVFYVSRWADEVDGCVTRLQRMPTGVVKAKRIVPKGTGYEPRLYEMSGRPPGEAQAMESQFMARLDAGAADALALLEAGLPDQEWTSRPRSAWSRFILAQMLRAPEDIAQLKSSVKEDWSQVLPEIAEIYAARRTPEMPATIAEYLSGQDRGETDEWALKIARILMNHPKIGQMLNNMHWRVLEIPASGPTLVTGDRPVWTTITLTEPDAFISMPIGPRKLFLAAPDPQTLSRLVTNATPDRIAARNLLTIQLAVKNAYGVDDAQLGMAQKHLATRRHSSLLELLAVARGHRVVDAASPSANLYPDSANAVF